MGCVWYHFFCKRSTTAQKAIKSISENGITTHPFRSGKSEGSGVVFFDEISQSLFDFLKEVSKINPDRILAIASTASIFTDDLQWKLLHAGASDALAWDRSDNFEKEVSSRLKRWEAIDELMTSPTIKNTLIGESSKWVSSLRQILEVAHYTDASILITGESGTGKELIARLIHAVDARPSKGNLVLLDCTTIVPELSGSEFFGHERGAFTGAVTAREGAFALADGGTLFLDEIGELPPGLQAQLMRVVQERTYKRVGGNVWHRTNFRLICATNRDLPRLATNGLFRHDLYYRIAGWSCKLPSLRERPEDILPLTKHFFQKLKLGEKAIELDEPVRQYLLRREYPGNVRDLEQLISRISYRHVGKGPITVGDIPEDERPSAPPDLESFLEKNFEQAVRLACQQGYGLKDIGQAAERAAMHVAYQDSQSWVEAARKLKISTRALEIRRAGNNEKKD